jgi:hypothetical protein
MNYNLNQIKAVLKKKGYNYFENGNYNVNIIGVRNLTSGNAQNDLFDDELYLIYKFNGNQIFTKYPITTDPGFQILRNPQNVKGTAILVPNQYKSAYQLGYHKGRYEALVQVGKVIIYRDNNRDGVMDFEKPDEGYFGINIHKAGLDSAYVQNWSAGCQVFKRETDFNQFMNVVKKSAELYGNKFTYTLLTSDDFD